MESHHFEELLSGEENRLHVVIEAGSVEIQPHQEKVITIDAETRQMELTVYRDHDTITVRAERESENSDLKDRIGEVIAGKRPKAVIKVWVPADCAVQARVVSGKLVIRDIEAPVTARVVTGQVQLENLTGPIYAKAITGSVKYVGQLSNQEHRFETVTGQVRLILTAEPDAQVDAGTVTGNVHCDFSLDNQVQRRRLTGVRIQGMLGAGTGNIVARVVTGSLLLERAKQKAYA